MLIDAHCHIDDEKIKDKQDEIISLLDSYGIECIINSASDIKSSYDAVELSQKYSKVFATVGVHPHCAFDYRYGEDEKILAELYGWKKTVAIGEIGLDYHYDFSPRDIQRKVFERQIAFASELNAPIVLHVREAYGEAVDILKRNRSKLSNGVLLHCYASSAEMVKVFNDFDCYYSFGGAVTFKGAKKADVLRAVPTDRLLLETDSPYMSPVPFRGQNNYPYRVKTVAEFISNELGVDFETLCLQTTLNAKRFYRLDGYDSI